MHQGHVPRMRERNRQILHLNISMNVIHERPLTEIDDQVQSRKVSINILKCLLMSPLYTP